MQEIGKILWRREWQPTPIFLPGESHEQRRPVGYSWWGCKESDTTEQLSTAHINIYIYIYTHTGKKENQYLKIISTIWTDKERFLVKVISGKGKQ